MLVEAAICGGSCKVAIPAATIKATTPILYTFGGQVLLVGAGICLAGIGIYLGVKGFIELRDWLRKNN